MPSNQLDGFKGNPTALSIGNAVLMQTSATLKVGDVTDSVRKASNARSQ